MTSDETSTEKPLPPRTVIFLGESQTSLFNRLAAKAIDSVIVVAVYFLCRSFSPAIASLTAATIAAGQDALGSGQSVGKRIVGIRVVDSLGVSCSTRSSALRNLPFWFSVLCTIHPLFWILLITLGIPALVLEVYLLFALTSGVRLGDVLGGTVVKDEFTEPTPGFRAESGH